MSAKRIGKQEAYRIARSNAAGLIESMDFDQLFGDLIERMDDQDDLGEILDAAQRKCVAFICGRPKP